MAILRKLFTVYGNEEMIRALVNIEEYSNRNKVKINE